MKKILQSLVLMLPALLLPATASAHDFEVDGIYYDINGNEVTVTYEGHDNVHTSHYSGAVTIPETVTYGGVTYAVTAISRSAFMNCSALTSVTIPKSITSISSFAFSGCSGLTSITVDSDNPKYDSRNDCNAIINTSYNKLVTGCQKTIIPNTVTIIGNGAFYGCNSLTSVTIPNSVTVIEVQAFAFCSGLTSATIGDSVNTIDEEAFGNCSSLKNVNIPNSVIAIGRKAFQNCSGLTDVYSQITNPSIVFVGNSAFYNSTGDYSGRTLHVPQGTAGTYQADENWYPYFGQIVERSMPGDVNGDGEVNIVDVNAVINVILGDGNNQAADVNNDGEVNIVDVNAVIELILRGFVAENIIGSWYSEYFVDEDGRYDIPEVIAVGFEFKSDHTGIYSYRNKDGLQYTGLTWNLQGQRLFIWYDDGTLEELYCKIDESGYMLLSVDESFNTYTAYRPVSPSATSKIH